MKSLEEISEIVKHIIGSSELECYNLYLATESTKDMNGEILEIGSLYGRTTIPIALAAKEQGKKLVAVDHLFQYPDLDTCVIDRKYPSKENIEDAFSKSTHLAFMRNLIEADVFDDVIIVASKSANLAEIWTKDIKFIFIDADHSYEGVKKDFEQFEPFVINGGLIAMHDIDPIGHPGVAKYFYEVMDSNRFSIYWHGDGTSCRIIRKNR